MSADRELLEMAAKAFWGDEIDDVCSVRWLDKDECIGYMHGDNQDHNGCDIELCWNPLTDDGDALRLAVKLNILTYQTGGDRSYASTPMNWSCTVPHYDNDALTSTRRAIVLAAAEVGKAMP